MGVYKTEYKDFKATLVHWYDEYDKKDIYSLYIYHNEELEFHTANSNIKSKDSLDEYLVNYVEKDRDKIHELFK